MRVLLFKLNGVPDDEADEVRALLGEHGIDFYETEAGRWRISLAAIWLHDEGRLEEAKGLIEAYQRERYERVRGEYERARREGRAEGLLDRIRRDPLDALVIFAVIALVLYLSLWPFIGLGG